MNSIFVILPYRWEGMWVFDDARVGLHREPFVSGADVMMDKLVADLPNAAKGFRLIFSAKPFPGTLEKRFKCVGAACTEENRRAYRELLFSTARLGEFISGVILFDETIRQKAADGTPLIEVLHRQGIIPGIKVDKGAKALA